MGELSLLIENHLVTWSGGATFDISWIGGHGNGEDVYRFTHYGVNQSTPVCLLYTSPSPRDKRQSRMPSSA